jgi:hypothetical protein
MRFLFLGIFLISAADLPSMQIKADPPTTDTLCKFRKLHMGQTITMI